VKGSRRSMALMVTAAGGFLVMVGCAAVGKGDKSGPPRLDDHMAAVVGCFGTYNGEPRGKDGRVDIARLLGELSDLRVNTYNWLLWHAATDWEDLQRFLPLARERGIRVWVSLVPPSESPPHTKLYSEPFKVDYERWATEIAKLSVREPNLVAWSIDDYAHNLKVYTPEQMRKIREAMHKENPRLAFVPCLYFRQVTPKFAEDYKGLLDGILFPYRHDSGKANLTDASQVEAEVQRIRELVGPGVPVIVDVYATKHARLEDSTPEYVRHVMEAGRRSADGVLIYCHQQRGTPKYDVIRQLFHRWAASSWGSTRGAR
jgi:hypothetical protein